MLLLNSDSSSKKVPSLGLARPMTLPAFIKKPVPEENVPLLGMGAPSQKETESESIEESKK